MEENIYFYDKTRFDWVKDFENNWSIIRNELLNVIDCQTSNLPGHAWMGAYPNYVLSEGSKPIAWRTYCFMFMGIKRKVNSEACPETARLLYNIEGITGAEFSIMEPHTHILPHKGFTQLVLRNHLGLIIPDKDLCAIRVGDQIRHWEEGKMLILDDSYEHEAWNKTHLPRAILMFDVVKPYWAMTPYKICRDKLLKTKDPFLIGTANNDMWVKWLEEGYFPEIN